MSVIVCRPEQVVHPYYVEGLGVNIHSSQEFCYAIYHHPMLFLDKFADQSVIDFIRDELGMGFLAARMEQRIKTKEKPEELMLMFMQECDYYTGAELNRFRQTVTSFRRMTPLEYAKAKTDYLARFKQYGKAITGYEAILEEADDKKDDLFIGKVWNNLGACYARIFQFQKAMDAYEKAYTRKKDLKILEKMYHLTCLCPDLELKDRYRSLVSQQLKEQWDKDFDQAGEKAAGSEELKKLDELFQKDSIRRAEAAGNLVEEWKKEYRAMG